MNYAEVFEKSYKSWRMFDFREELRPPYQTQSYEAVLLLDDKYGINRPQPADLIKDTLALLKQITPLGNFAMIEHQMCLYSALVGFQLAYLEQCNDLKNVHVEAFDGRLYEV